MAASGQKVTAAADVFSLASLTYELITGAGHQATACALHLSTRAADRSACAGCASAGVPGAGRWQPLRPSPAHLAPGLSAGKQLLPVACSAADHRSRIGGLMGVDMSAVPEQVQVGTRKDKRGDAWLDCPTRVCGGEALALAHCCWLMGNNTVGVLPPWVLQGALRSMLALQPGMRPPAAAFASSPWFAEDVSLRALRFLDTMLQVGGGGVQLALGQDGCPPACCTARMCPRPAPPPCLLAGWLAEPPLHCSPLGVL